MKRPFTARDRHAARAGCTASTFASSSWLGCLPASLMLLAMLCLPAVAVCAQAGNAPAAGASAARPQAPERSGRIRGRAPGEEDTATGPPQPLAGRVVSSADKHPLTGATVQLTGQRSNREVASTRTDAAGHYSFPPEPAGKYHLRASAPDYRTQLYLEHDGYSASVVLGEGLPTGALNFELVPGASIHGRITDESGDAPQRAQVQLFRILPASALVEAQGDAVPRVQRMRGAPVDDEGRYEFDDLQAGQYYVSVTAQPWYAVHPPSGPDRDLVNYRVAIDPALDVAYPQTFYPGATTDDGAQAISLREGQRVAANISLVPQHAVSLQLRLPDADEGIRGRGMPTLSRQVFGLDEGVQATYSGFSQAGNTVTISGIAPGSYHVSQGGLRGSGSGDATVTLSGGSVPVITVPGSGTGGDLHVRVTALEGVLPATGMVLIALRDTERGGGGPTVPIEQGAANFSGLAAGSYRLVAQAGGERWSAVRLLRDGRPLPLRTVAVESGSAPTVDLVVSRYAPTVRGIARGPGKTPEPGAMAVLVPAGADSGPDLYRRDETDLDGSFNFAGVVPGNYLLLAVRDGWSLPWTDPAALAPYLMKATPVVVPVAGPATETVSDGVAVQPLH